MWSRTVILGVVFSFYCVLGKEIPDVTTIYEIDLGKSIPVKDPWNHENTSFVPSWYRSDSYPPGFGTYCINGIAGHIHARTNALGLGFINEDYKYFDSNGPEFPNITCDANFLYDGGCTDWELGSEVNWKLHDESPARISVIRGAAYKVKTSLAVRIQDTKRRSYLVFTQGPGSLQDEKIEMVIVFRWSNNEKPNIMYNCDNGTRYSRFTFDVLDRDGSPINVYCQSHYGSFPVSSQDILTFTFPGEEKVFRIYTGKGGSKSLAVDWNNYEYNYGLRFNINYFSHLTYEKTYDESDFDSFTFVPKAFEVTSREILSPIFTPQSNNLCLAMFFHSSTASPFNELEISVLGLLPNDRYQLDFIDHIKSGWNTKVVNVSLENLNPIKLSLEISGMANISFARISSCNPEGEEVVQLPLMFDCPPNKTGDWKTGSSLQLHTTSVNIMDPVKIMANMTNPCWNGGALTSVGCACTPGFIGSKCEIGCGRNRFGQDCEGLCSYYTGECQGLLLCNKFTGCRCAPGYRGDDCTQACQSGWYGNDCSEKCGHCAENSTCNIYTGECTRCKEGYLFPHCKLASVYYGSKPEVTSPSYGSIVVSFDPNNFVSESEPPHLYQIQFREKGDQWKVFTTKSLHKSNEETEKDKNNVVEKIEGLKSGILFQVRVILIDAYFLKYDGDLVQIAEILTKCDIPLSYDYKVSSLSNSTAITYSWRYVVENQNWCPLETFEVTWREGWKRKNMFTKNNLILNNLVSGLAIKFKVRAITSGGAAPYSKTVTTLIQQSELPPVINLQVVSSQSTSVKLSWKPPRGNGNGQLQYTISYKCVDQPACSPGCQNITEGQLTQEGTSIDLSPLQPFTKYLVTVSAEGGIESSIYVGTTKVVPTEVPILSAQRPVRTNTSLTVFWDQGPVCTGYLLGYNYQLTKASDGLKILASGFTKETNASFHNLTASTDYIIRVFVFTVGGWNPSSYMAINISTSATVPEAVRNLTVYKRGRGMLGLRWAEPRSTYGQLKSFTVTHTLGQETTSHTVEPSHCVVWPDLYCHTIEGLRSNKRYNVSVSARNEEVAEDGEFDFVSAVTKESPPSAPVNLKVTDRSSTSIKLEWNYPEMANGVVRSFLISVEETEKYDQDSCCQIYPFVEISVKEELPTYSAEVSGLHPASTYFVSVSGKTVGLGPSQTLVAYTSPPHLPFTSLPRILEPELTWLPQEKPLEVNNSDVYTSLIRVHLLLAVINETQPALGSGITDPKLNSFLQETIGKPFYFIAEYNQDDDIEVTGPLEDSDSAWGRPPASLPPLVSYQLVATQILEYNGVYNVDLRHSESVTLSN